jgi:hypothetical protein
VPSETSIMSQARCNDALQGVILKKIMDIFRLKQTRVVVIESK